MSNSIQAIRGMNDQLPDELICWQQLERTASEVFRLFGYREVRLPVVEKTELFARSIGQATDIVEKEMYTFQGRNGDQLSLRPEGTAGVVRAMLQHGLLHNAIQRIWYTGPMFRHERPQKGRYRQFHQIGVEAYGMAEADLDVEVISLTWQLWKQLGLTGAQLEINTLGTAESRKIYRSALVDFYQSNRDSLDEDSLRRLEKNPLRILDSKNAAVIELNRNAPDILDYLDDESSDHFQRVQLLLDKIGISYIRNPKLVRGLDYYSRTVFEWTTDKLGAQSAICGGGRYDDLVEKLGGKPAPAAGFAIGMERLIELMKIEQLCQAEKRQDIYIVQTSDTALKLGTTLAMELRDAGFSVTGNVGDTSFKSQLKKANRCNARLALIIGDDELQTSTISVKKLDDGEQFSVSRDNLLAEASKYLAKTE
ncbi:MAG: histidine--tRNA ligase [Gammaproteobacteria bacterium]|nr:histidine--tRNA ligase [Gammaproteobacteria bacterium]MDX2486168.1 histidine--tRNA ligase [Gammaproteobacteria bacterium]